MQKARGPKLSPLKLDKWTGHLCRPINRLRLSLVIVFLYEVVVRNNVVIVSNSESMPYFLNTVIWKLCTCKSNFFFSEEDQKLWSKTFRFFKKMLSILSL